LQPSKLPILLLVVSSYSPQSGGSDQDIFHHSVQCFLLDNIVVWTQSSGVTHLRGIQRCLHSQLKCNTKVYIDDVVVKTQEDEGIIYLVETFDNLRKLKMKLNLEKCMFSVPFQKLLGYMFS
jgi:hypothetical protein